MYTLIPIAGERDDVALILSIKWLSLQFGFPSSCSPFLPSDTKVLVTAPLHILRRLARPITFFLNPICAPLLLLLSLFSVLRPMSLRHALLLSKSVLLWILPLPHQAVLVTLPQAVPLALPSASWLRKQSRACSTNLVIRPPAAKCWKCSRHELTKN
ncbi:hypothetical protein EDB85DRAFT_496171 [Lactarius pseudohatsudake]|nr:hypothetical protein EDB85DRAFT_496171 [Lactarius pseudohatsudake]